MISTAGWKEQLTLLKEFNDLDLIFDTYRAQAEELAKKAKIRDDNDIFFKKN